MEQTIVNGKAIKIKPTLSTFSKTAYVISEEIYNSFKQIGIEEKYIDFQIPRNPLQRESPAEIAWYVNGKEFFYRCSTQNRYVDNLGVIGKIIHQESYAIRNGLKTFGQVMNQFSLEFQEGDKIRSPREIIGVEENNKDLDYITFKYKQKAKELHPDTDTGDTKKFQELEKAYKDIKKQLSNDPSIA